MRFSFNCIKFTKSKYQGKVAFSAFSAFKRRIQLLHAFNAHVNFQLFIQIQQANIVVTLALLNHKTTKEVLNKFTKNFLAFSKLEFKVFFPVQIVNFIAFKINLLLSKEAMFYKAEV